MNIKPGVQTTEFWLGLLSIILAYLNKTLGWNIPTEQVLGMFSIVVAWIFSRTWLKSSK